MSEINLGRITTTICEILKEDGYIFETTFDMDTKPEDIIAYKDAWSLKVSEDTKDKLRKLAMPMKKPIRNQSKTKENKPKKEKEIVDVLDIIYGLNK